MKEKILGGVMVGVATMVFIAGCTAGSLLARCIEMAIDERRIRKTVKEYEKEKGTN